MAKSFVAISGVSDSKQLGEISRIANEIVVYTPLVIGYQFSGKSINQGTQNQRQPLFRGFKGLYDQTNNLGMIPAIHYYAKEGDSILGDLEKMSLEIGGAHQTLLQFNTLPQTVETLKEVKEMGYETLFKVAVANKKIEGGGYKVWKGEGVEDASSGNVGPLVDQVVERKDVITYAMFDPSHGTNLELELADDDLAIKFGAAITSNPMLDDLGIIYAGGIKPENVGGVTKILERKFPGRISIDIESGVRTENVLDMGKVRAYLENYQKALD